MDPKLNTFLTVCETMNYHTAARLLHLTQPAVTKQIQALETQYGKPLFSYDGRQLHKTEACRILEDYARSIRCNVQEMERAMAGQRRRCLRIGATKTIGDYVLRDAVSRYTADPTHELTLIVDNTEHLLTLLDDNKLDFLAVEGIFDKSRYGWQLLKREPFTGICAPDHPFAGKIIPPEDLLAESLIVREPGSGTRDIFERQLALCGYHLDAFRRLLTISSFPVICQLVKEGRGISFLYQSVAGDDPAFGHFQAEPLTGIHEFHVVYLKRTRAKEYAEAFFQDLFPF